MPIYLFSSDRKISKPRINIGEFFRYKCQGIKGKAAVKRGSNVGTCTNYVMTGEYFGHWYTGSNLSLLNQRWPHMVHLQGSFGHDAPNHAPGEPQS